MTERIADLRDAVQKAHSCKAIHVGSEPVVELFNGEIAWDGVVEIFVLVDHKKARRCYAWSYVEEGKRHYSTVLEIPPVESAETAVKVAIAASARQQ